MECSGEANRVVIHEPTASKADIRRATLRVAIRASFDAQDAMCHTYAVLEKLSKEPDVSKETGRRVNALIDALRAVGTAMAHVHVNARLEYGIVAGTPEDMERSQ